MSTLCFLIVIVTYIAWIQDKLLSFSCKYSIKVLFIQFFITSLYILLKNVASGPRKHIIVLPLQSITANQNCERIETYTDVHMQFTHHYRIETGCTHAHYLAVLIALTGNHISLKMHANAVRHFLGTNKLFVSSVALVNCSEN